MHYLGKKIQALPIEEQQILISELIESIGKTAPSVANEISLVLMADFTDLAQERAKHFGQFQGLSSGYPSIDALTKGFVAGEMTVVAGKTSFGKTTLAVNIANKVALDGGRVLFVTMEMTHVELTSRFMFINGGNTDAYQQVSSHIVFQRNDELNWKSIDGLIRRAVEEMEVNLVVIDHLHYFSRELENVAEDLGRITKEIKKNAGRHKVPVLLVSHVRKTFKDQQATMDDLRGSSYIAQDADIVLMVGRNQANPKEFGVLIEKNRNRGFDPNDNEAKLLFNKTIITERPEFS